MTSPGGFLGRVVDWLREGYPTGIPRQDTVPVLALMRRRLNEDELLEVIVELRDQHFFEPSEDDIAEQIRRVTEMTPDPEDVLRVADHFAFRTFPHRSV